METMPQPFTTTVVGSLPKPAWLYQQRPLAGPGTDHHGSGADWNFEGELLERAQDDATRLAIHTQESAGIDIISDGEQRRKSYLTYIANRLTGFDYESLAEKWIRDGRRLAQVGRCVGPVGWPGPLAVDDLRFLKAETTRPVKMTLPGPMTIVDSTFDAHYGNDRDFAMAVAAAINMEALELDKLGPAVIQIDEPVFSRYPEQVADWGIEALDRCLEGVNAATAVHVCYSYAMPGVPRPIKPSYPVILAELERSSVEQLALEFEAPRLDPALLELCPSKTVLFGCVDNGNDTVEAPDWIAGRLMQAARYHDPEKLQAAPDCGLVPLSPELARAKLHALVAGARLAREKL
jgi:5-methyltetrahydropteroyltriglutamate--homocysteine methyltransferase